MTERIGAKASHMTWLPALFLTTLLLTTSCRGPKSDGASSAGGSGAVVVPSAVAEIARLRSARGGVKATIKGQEGWVDLKDGDAIVEGMTIVAGGGASATIEFPGNGSVVSLSEETTLTLTRLRYINPDNPRGITVSISVLSGDISASISSQKGVSLFAIEQVGGPAMFYRAAQGEHFEMATLPTELMLEQKDGGFVAPGDMFSGSVQPGRISMPSGSAANIPEPGTWALFTFGAGLVFALKHKHHRGKSRRNRANPPGTAGPSSSQGCAQPPAD